MPNSTGFSDSGCESHPARHQHRNFNRKGFRGHPMAVKTTTPPEITQAIRRLIERVVPGGEAVYLTVQPETDAVVNECFPNVEAKIARAGSRMLCGWQLWEWPHVLVEAEFHAVWLSPEGEMVDITPKPDGEARVLFVRTNDVAMVSRLIMCACRCATTN